MLSLRILENRSNTYSFFQECFTLYLKNLKTKKFEAKNIEAKKLKTKKIEAKIFEDAKI